MATVQSVLDALQVLAPTETAFAFDKVGLQVGEGADPVAEAVVALDASPGMIEFARAQGAELAVCHHPIIWEPLTAVNGTTRSGRLAAELIRAGIAFIAAHTNWDAAPGGINGRLAHLLGIQNPRPAGSGQPVPFFKLVVFAPASAANPLIDALSGAGAGVIGQYSRCAFQSSGQGTFRGGADTKPAVGAPGKVETVDEVRIEMRVPEVCLSSVLKALRDVHPYEEPAYDLLPVRPSVERPCMQIGTLAEPVSAAAFVTRVDSVLRTRSWAFGDPAATVRTVAVCGGAADDEWRAAKAEGADLFVSGEVKHHNAVEAAEEGLCIVAAGHYATEHPGCVALAEALARAVPEVNWSVFEPSPGQCGRTFEGV